jgi:hypothetical protein
VSAASQVSIQGNASSELGSETAFVATVTGNNPGGSVQFKDGGANLGEPASVVGGLATLRTSALGLGGHSITAAYLGDGGANAPSTSSGLSHTVVNILPTRVEIGSSANPVGVNSSLTITVSVSGLGATPTGTVSLRDSADLLDTKSLSGGSATFSLGTLAGGLHSISAHYSGDGSNPAATSNTLFQEVSLPPGMVSLTTAKIGFGSGTVTSYPIGISCGSSCVSNFVSGSPVTLTATPAAGSEFRGWRGGNCSGTGTCNVSSTLAATVTAVFQEFSTIPRLENISTRMPVLTGNDVMIAGFVIGGAASKQVAIVVTGPSLAQYGISNPLANPKVTLVRSSDQSVLASNDDWQSASNAAQMLASGFAPTNVLEPAILATLPPGAYTAIVEGVGGGTGVAVAAVYEVGGFDIPLINISTRGRVQTGGDVMIGGFVVQGNASQTFAIVATGPSLAPYGITNPLGNPKLTLVRSSDQTVIAANDNWQSASNASQLQAAGFAPGNALEAALLVTLPPGAYTAVVEGADGGTGVGVIGVYKVN